MNLVIAMWDLNQPYYFAVANVIAWACCVGHTASRKDRARRRHPSARGRS